MAAVHILSITGKFAQHSGRLSVEMDPQSKSKPPSAKLFWLVWLTTLALVAGSIFLFYRYGPLAANAKVFRQTAQGWEPAPPLDSRGYNIRVSPSDVVWVQTARGLSRLDGTSWHHFTASDFGTERGRLAGFALDGDEVWGAASDGVVHFDGKRWQRYSNVVAMEQATSIAAANRQVWVIDRAGNLSHFDGARWTVRKLDLPGVRWGAGSDRGPELAVTGHGTLWLAFQGLWRSDGASWTRITGTTNDAALLGTTSPGSYLLHGKSVNTLGEIWISYRGEMAGFDERGGPPVRYTLHDLGFLDSTTVYRIAGRAPFFAVTSDQGIVWFDGTRWHAEQLKSLGMVTASSIALSPDGSLWGIGYPSTSPQSVLYRSAAFANVILTLFALGFPLWWFSRKARHQGQITREAILHATGALPEDSEEPSPWKTAGGVVLVLVLGGAGYGAVKHYWPATPTWLLPVFFLTAHLTTTFAGSLKKRKPKPSDPIGPGGPPRYDWAKSIPAILGSLAVAVLLYGGSIARHFHIGWLAAIPGVAFVFGGQFVFHAYEMFRVHRAEREIKGCRYGQALEMLDGPLGWPSTWFWKLVRADALFFSGRARDAEPILRELLETGKDPGSKALAFEHLGRVLMAQNRYDDAKRTFEAAAKVMPMRPAAYSGLAELRLLQDLDPVQALEDAERALRLHRDSLLDRKGNKDRLATLRGNQAWALARLGRGAESQQAIEAGAREMDSNYIPEVAGFYWRAGMAMLAIENVMAASSHFRRAAELDSQGYYGKLAARHLSQHSVWGAVGIA